MSPRTAILVVAISLLGAGFVAFVRLAGGAGPAWGPGVSVGSTQGGTDQRRGDGEAFGADVASAPGSRPSVAAVGGASGAAGEAGEVGDAGGEAGGDAGGARGPDEAGWSERITAAMRKLVRDLEYTKGLPEPPQQVVRPAPEPWRPDPTREGPPPEVAEVRPLRGRAAGGERVEIRGRNLRVVSVMFGSAPARLLLATDALVAVEAPPGAPGPVAIVLTNEDGTWGAVAEPYVYGE